MKTQNKTIKRVLLILPLLFSFTSCSKKETVTITAKIIPTYELEDFNLYYTFEKDYCLTKKDIQDLMSYVHADIPGYVRRHLTCQSPSGANIFDGFYLNYETKEYLLPNYKLTKDITVYFDLLLC